MAAFTFPIPEWASTTLLPFKLPVVNQIAWTVISFFVREFLAQRVDFYGHRTEDGGDARGGSSPRGITHLGDACCRE